MTPLAEALGKLSTSTFLFADRWRLLMGDAIYLLGRLPRHSVDLVFADPPYMLSNGGTTCSGGERVAVDKGEWDRSAGLLEDHAFHMKWLEAVRYVLRPSGTLWVSGTYHSIPSVGFALQRLGYHTLNLVTWHKPNPPPNLGCRTFTHSCEHLIWAAPEERPKLLHHFDYAAMREANGGKQMHDIWSVPTTPAREKTHGHHPTQKPEALLELVLRASARPGAVVLDPFCGSGTTGVVALRLGCTFIGIDLSAEYLDLSHKRLQAPSAPTGAP